MVILRLLHTNFQRPLHPFRVKIFQNRFLVDVQITKINTATAVRAPSLSQWEHILLYLYNYYIDYGFASGTGSKITSIFMLHENLKIFIYTYKSNY